MIGDLGPDANGCPTEEWDLDGQRVIVHYDDIPESDITTINGLRVTTPLRTVIDLAASLGPDQLDDLVRDFLDHGLFTRDEARARLARPDMMNRPGAVALRRRLLL